MREGTRHALDHVELATLHVDLHDVGGIVDAFVQPHDRHTQMFVTRA